MKRITYELITNLGHIKVDAATFNSVLDRKITTTITELDEEIKYFAVFYYENDKLIATSHQWF